MLQTKEEIKLWLNEHGAYNYEITDELIVNVFNELDLSNKKLTEIPIRFGTIHGFFNCSNNQLTHLPPCKEVKKALWANNNQIDSLEGFPIIQGSNIRLENNKITSFKGLPEEIKSSLYLDNNQLISLEYCPKIIDGDLNISCNPFTSLTGIARKIKGDLICCHVSMNILHANLGEIEVSNYIVCDISTDIDNELSHFYQDPFQESDNPQYIYISLEALKKYQEQKKLLEHLKQSLEEKTEITKAKL